MSAAKDIHSAQEEEVLGKAYDLKLLLRLWPYVRPHLGTLILALSLIPLLVGLEMVQPYLLMIAIDDHIAIRELDGLGSVAILFVICVVIHALVNFGQLYALQLVGQKSMHDLRSATYRHVVTRRAAFFDRVPIGRLLTRMTNDVESINEMFASGVVTIIADFVKLLGIIGVMLYLDVVLTLYTFLTLPLLFLLVNWARQIMRTSFRAIRVKMAAMNAHVQEHLSGIKVVQLFGREKRAAQDFDRINADHRDAYLWTIRADATMYAVVEAIGVGSVALIAWYSGKNIGETGLTVGLVVAFVEYVNKFFIPVKDLSAKYAVMQSAMAAAERIMKLHDTEEEDAPTDSALSERALARLESPDAGVPQVEFDSVEFSYRPSEPILRGLNLRVSKGETVAVVGATGSGKSTIIKLLTRLYEPQAGTIRLLGVDISELPAVEMRRRVTVVSQDVFLFAGTIADNVRLGRPDATDEEIEEALQRVGADRVLSRRGSSIHEEVEDRGGNFSAGERQLIAFARALVRNPDVLILDEATAHVDPETEAAIERGLEALMQGRTSLVIAHRLSTIRRADQIVVVARGRVAEAGKREQLLEQQGMYAALEATFLRD